MYSFNCMLFITFHSLTLLLIINCNLILKVIAVPTSTVSYPTENDVSSSTYRYELMDSDVESCKIVWPIFEPKNLTELLPDQPVDGMFIFFILFFGFIFLIITNII